MTLAYALNASMAALGDFLEGPLVFSVVRRLPDREDVSIHRQGQRAGVGQSPREETAECCEAFRECDVLWGFGGVH